MIRNGKQKQTAVDKEKKKHPQNETQLGKDDSSRLQTITETSDGSINSDADDEIFR
jgi:hypothetical protein